MTKLESNASPTGGLLRRTLRRRWVPLFSQWGLLTAALLSAAYVLVVGPYQTSSVLRFNPDQSVLFGGKTGAQDLDWFIETQVQLLTSHNVLTAAAATPKVAALPRIRESYDVVAELRGAIRIHRIPGTYLLEVSSRSSSPTESATIANAVVDSYLDTSAQWTEGMRQTEIKALDTYRRDLNNQIEALEERWKALVARGDADQKAKQANLVSPEHGIKIEAKLIENDLARLEAQAELDALRDRASKDPKRIDELETRVDAANRLERALKERRASGAFEPRTPLTDDVEIKVTIDQRQTLRSMDDAVRLRLEQLRFESTNGARVRVVSVARPPGQRIQLWYRPWVLAIIPFATFVAVFGLFAGVEARSIARISPVNAEPPAAA